MSYLKGILTTLLRVVLKRFVQFFQIFVYELAESQICIDYNGIVDLKTWNRPKRKLQQELPIERKHSEAKLMMSSRSLLFG